MTGTEKPYTVRGVDEILLDLRRVYGSDRAALVWSSLTSAYDRLLFARHHLQLLRKAALPAVRQGLETSGFLEMINNDDDVEALFSQSMHQIKMHVTDCIQHMHAVGDTIAFTVYFFVEVPKESQLKKKSDIDLISVRKLLKNCPALPGAEAFLVLLDQLAEKGDYAYLSDLNNHAKHRSIVGPAVSLPCDVEVPENEQKNLLIFPMVEMKCPPPSLQNRGATPCHAQRPITPFVEGELARIWDIYGQIRREVEDQIRIAPSSAAYAAARGG